MSAHAWVELDTHQDGTNCLGCRMSLRHCQDREPGEVDVRCCLTCSHPESTTAKTAVPQMTHTDWETLRHLLEADLRRADEYPELLIGTTLALGSMDGLERVRREQSTVTAPDDISDYYGQPCARWGQCVIPAGEERDPVPAVYSNPHDGGQVEIEGLRLSLDVAEQFAARIANAVRYQRAQAASPVSPQGVKR